MSDRLNDTQRVTLRALCDTFVPSIKVRHDPTGFWARNASDLGVNRVLARCIEDLPNQDERRALLGLLDVLAAQGFVKQSQSEREKTLRRLSASSPQAAAGITFYENKTLQFNYGLPETPGPDPDSVTYGSIKGQNPNWEVLGYPGPVSVPPHKPKQIQVLEPSGDLSLEADVCVVGAGAGGGVIAGTLAQRGYRVVVLERGGNYSSSDYNQLELWGYKHLWFRGGPTPTANGTVELLAGSTMGGGTEVNWMNCIRTPPLVREQWTREYGLEGVDTPEYDRYMDSVESRISAGSETADYNATNARIREGCKRLNYLTKQTKVNALPELFNPLLAGYTGFGDQTGSKQSTRRTYLLDAYRNGAQIVAHCLANRILIEQGRAAGVDATYSAPDGRQAKVTVRAPQVVVACGSLESPALLLRTGIGGPAVGNYLRLHPGGALYGIYKEKQPGWWGWPQTANCEEFTNTGDGYGFYLEAPAFGPGFVAAVTPWTSGKQHKQMMTRVPYISTFIWFVRDQGHGQVTIDQAGESVITYQMTNKTDQKNFHRAAGTAARIQAAAGAQEIYFSLANRQIIWKKGQGESLESYIRRIQKQPLLDGAQPMISAHQMGSCRMGRDPATSVADPNGQLHDVKGVWIGDASAFPTASGANPMISIMSLATRTADKITAASQPSARSFVCSSMGDAAGMAAQPIEMMANMATGMFRGMMGIMTNPMNVLGVANQMMSQAGGWLCPGCGQRSSQPGGCSSCGESVQ